MSEVKDKFYELFTPKMEVKGFTFKKSAGNFIKIQGDLQYTIHFKWDGRGGTSMIDWIDYFVTEPSIEKAYKKLTGTSGFAWHQHYNIPLMDVNGKLNIPVMYTQVVLDLANNMNFKALAQIPFEEKYPIARIQNCVNRVETLLNDNAFPFFEKYTTELKVYEVLCKSLNETENLEDTASNLILSIKIYAKKLGLPEPERLKDYEHHITQLKESYGYMNKVDFDTLEERLANYKF